MAVFERKTGDEFGNLWSGKDDWSVVFGEQDEEHDSVT